MAKTKTEAPDGAEKLKKPRAGAVKAEAAVIISQEEEVSLDLIPDEFKPSVESIRSMLPAQKSNYFWKSFMPSFQSLAELDNVLEGIDLKNPTPDID